MKKSIPKKLAFLATVAAMLVWLIPAAVLAAPMSPSGLIAIAVDGGRVDLYWTDNAADETGFNIERAPDVGGLGPGEYVQIGSVNQNITTYSDTTVAAQKSYWYRVKSVNASGQSLPSNEVGIRTPVAAPQVTLVTPAPSPAVLRTETENAITVTATDSGATVTGVEFQVIADNEPGVFNAKDIYEVPMDLTLLAARAAAPVANAQAMPAGLPAGAVAEFEIRGTVASVNTGTGEWQIGSPAITVYESVTGNAVSTKFIGSRHPVVGDAVKVFAYRTTAGPGPLVARSIRYMAPAQPMAAPAVVLSFLYNGAVSAMVPPVTDLGYLISGEIWSIGGGRFRIDAPEFPAYIDAGVDMGVNVTVRFAPLPAPANIAREIFQQISSAIQNTIDTNLVFETTPAPLGAPPGTWLYVIVDGVVSGKDVVTGTWTIGEEGVKVYQEAATLVDVATVGDEVLMYCRRTMTPGPLVAEQISNILPGPLSMPYKGTAVETHLMYNGVIQSMGLNTWTVGGQTFIVDDPEGKARIDPLPYPAFNIGDSVTVRFDRVGETLPDNANWVPLTQDAGTGNWNGTVTPPGIPGVNLPGTLYLRGTDSLQFSSTTAVPATLAFFPGAPPVAPSGLSATVPSGSQVDLTWTDNSTDEDYFRIERAPDAAGPWALLGSTAGADVTAYSDMTVSPYTTYYYRVKAVNAAGPSAPSDTYTVTTTPPPAKTAFITPVRTINAGLPSMEITIQVQDVAGNPANVAADAAVALTSNSGTGLFDTSAAGAFDGSVTSVTVLAGSNTASFYYKDSTLGAPTITATPAGLNASQQMEMVVAADAVSQIGFVTAPQTVQALLPSAVITIQSQDGAGNPVNVGANTVVNLTSTSAGGKFDLLDTGPFSGAITSVTIPAGSNTVDFYYRDAVAGTPTIRAAATGLNSGLQTETITPAPAAMLAFTTQPGGAVSGMAFTTQPVVAVQDAAGNTVTSYVGNVTVAITAGTGNAGATLSGTTTVAAVNGVAAFTDLSIDFNGNGYRLDVTSDALVPATSNLFNVIAPPQTVNVSLWSGWNLVSPPVIPTNTTRDAVLSGIAGSVISVWAYDAATGYWSSWNPIVGGDLSVIRDGKGYWLNTSSAATLAITGTPLPPPPVLPPTYSVVPGWNLLGFKSATPKTAAEYLTGTDYRFPVYGFGGGAWTSITSGATNMEPGMGYWVYFNTAGTVTP